MQHGHARHLRLPLRPQRHRRRCLDEEPARRQGRQPGRDVPARHPGAVGFHHQHRSLHRLHRARARRRAGADRRRGASRRRLRRTRDGQAIRQCRRPAAAVGAFGRARVHARHDGHHPQPRPERRSRGRPGAQSRQRALRVGLVPPLRADVRRRGDGLEARQEGRARPLRGDHRRLEGTARRDAGHAARRGRPEGTGGALQGADPRAAGPRISHRPLAAAVGRRGGRVRELEQRPRPRLP